MAWMREGWFAERQRAFEKAWMRDSLVNWPSVFENTCEPAAGEPSVRDGLGAGELAVGNASESVDEKACGLEGLRAS
jgi:hypothetical protein